MNGRGPTPRQQRLRRHAVVAVLITAVVAGAVWLRESRPAASDTASGISDVLRRDLPADAPAVQFVDATAAAGLRFRHFGATRSRLLPEDMGSGLGWGDCDLDGDDDLYVVNFAAPMTASEAELARRPGSALFRNEGDGTFTDITAESGAGAATLGMGVSWADYDGDADLDLYVTSYGRNRLLRNDGGCRFSDVTAASGVAGDPDEFSAGSSWADYDGDGDLDLYVTSYVRFDLARAEGGDSLQFGQAVPFTLNPASYTAAPNRLYRNDAGRFVDVAAESGVANEDGRSLAAAWVDFDEDGDQDLYVANDISDNALYLNRGDGTFQDVSAESLTADYRGAMGLAVADFDRDGDQDFFVTHWVAQENGLYRNHLEVGAAGGLFFADVAEMMGLGYTALQYVGWGTDFIDFDNDGREDLVVVNGHTIEDSADRTRLLPQRMQLFWNRGDEGYYDLSEVAGPPFGRMIVGRGAATSDYDGDGDLDVAVLEHGGSLILLGNQGASDNRWLQIDLRQAGPNRFGVGALIRVGTAGVTQSHRVGASPSYLSSHSLTAHFGLGRETRIDPIVVRWPDGIEERFEAPTVDTRITLERGTGR